MKSLKLGPMPESVRQVVERLVAEAQRNPPAGRTRPNGFCLTGGPTGCCYLDADGTVWHWWFPNDEIQIEEDGPRKVGLVAIAAERFPALLEWLPKRPKSASDCDWCKASGRFEPPLPPIQCSRCNGLGWLEDAEKIEQFTNDVEMGARSAS